MTINHKRGGRRVGTRSASGLAGTNSVKLSSVVNGRALRPGTYRVKLVAVDSAGNRSRTKRVRFTVAR